MVQASFIQELGLISPVVAIVAGALIVLMLDAFTRSKKCAFYCSLAVLLITGIAAACNFQCGAAWSYSITAPVNSGSFLFGGVSALFDIIFVLAGFLTVIASREYLRKGYHEYNEFYSLILLSVAGMVIVAHSRSLLMMFLGIETMSITFYALCGFFRNREHAVESALKYFILGSFASAFLLYGIAMIYGATGSIDLLKISGMFFSQSTAASVNYLYFAIGISLIIVGLCFKCAAFPFHQWAPDVYYGAPTVVGGFICTAGKSAAFAAFCIIGLCLLNQNLGVKYPAYIFDTTIAINVIAVISATTMIIGNLSALAQKDVKRMLVYSSVAHAGYILMGIVAGTREAYFPILYYCFAYLFMQLGAFIVISWIETADEKNLQISDYANLRSTHPYLAAAMACFMFSLAGIPPFGGFFGKYFLFVAAVKAGFTWLTIVAVIASIISMYFYIGLVLTMFFKPNDTPLLPNQKPGAASISIAICFAGTLLLGLFPGYIYGIMQALIGF